MFCQRCGARIFPGMKICPNCGETVKESFFTPPQKKVYEKKSRSLLFVVLGVFILAGIAVALFLALHRTPVTLEIKSISSQWTDYNSTLLIFGEVENNTRFYVEPRFKVNLTNLGQQVGSDYFGSLIQEPYQSDSSSSSQGAGDYEVRESMLKPGERGYYLVAVRNIKGVEFDQFLVSVETLSQMSQEEANALRNAARAYANKILDLMEKWEDDLRVANSTARIALAPVVTMLQEDKRKLAAIELPENQKIQDIAIGLQVGMDTVIEGFLQFMQENDTLASSSISVGMDSITKNLGQLHELMSLP